MLSKIDKKRFILQILVYYLKKNTIKILNNLILFHS